MKGNDRQNWPHLDFEPDGKGERIPRSIEPEPRDKRVVAMFTQGEYEALREMSYSKRMSMSAIIHACVTHVMKKDEWL